MSKYPDGQHLYRYSFASEPREYATLNDMVERLQGLQAMGYGDMIFQIGAGEDNMPCNPDSLDVERPAGWGNLAEPQVVLR